MRTPLSLTALLAAGALALTACGSDTAGSGADQHRYAMRGLAA